VKEGEGVIAWVALKQQSVRIDDLGRSPFREIHWSVADGVRSELAVPMIAGSDLIGVLNLESLDRQAFSEETVRTVSYAANQAAIAFRLARQVREQRALAEMTSELLTVCQKPVAGRKAARRRQDEMASTICESLKANRCDLWKFFEESGVFRSAGSTHPDSTRESLPRRKGWSDFVRRKKQPLCITNVQAVDRFDVLLWNYAREAWEEPPPNSRQPRTVNRELVSLNIRCEFGFPILVRRKCIGVAWIKYEQPRAVLQPDQASLAAAFAGLVLYKGPRFEAGVPSRGTMSLATGLPEGVSLLLD
jgi:GAF domain-containing protein